MAAGSPARPAGRPRSERAGRGRGGAGGRPPARPSFGAPARLPAAAPSRRPPPPPAPPGPPARVPPPDFQQLPAAPSPPLAPSRQTAPRPNRGAAPRHPQPIRGRRPRSAPPPSRAPRGPRVRRREDQGLSGCGWPTARGRPPASSGGFSTSSPRPPLPPTAYPSFLLLKRGGQPTPLQEQRWTTKGSRAAAGQRRADMRGAVEIAVQSCPTLCDPMDCSTPGLPVHRQHHRIAVGEKTNKQTNLGLVSG
ncbi:formin-like protein 20 [Bubalus bubalis]|uniref:formin-like protein 20 n=1 Tax=Bubalus bubalis TaxID=89462 RepID=UPI001E1B8E3E|nr:formin-like protein 20 [Bubalus bubalis]